MNTIITSLRRTPYQTFAALSVLFFTLLLSGGIFVILTFLQGLLGYVETRPRVIVYFQVKTPEKDIFAIRDKIKATNKAIDVTYISQDEAYKIYEEFTENDPLLLEMTSPDILPASLEIDALKPEYLPEIAEFVSGMPGVDEVQYQKDIINNLLNLTSSIRKTASFFFAYLMFMSIIVLTTTLSFKIALKRDEIQVLKLLGATNSYIRAPFVNESVTLGIMAAVLANIILIGTMLTLNTVLATFFAGIPELTISLSEVQLQVWPFNIPFILFTLGVTALFSLFITLFSSYAATNRYL
ncbi:MAG: permease-like cell division protein FtsX [bacterium]|nr:permease-like cell division protein FtsX [bacterium]